MIRPALLRVVPTILAASLVVGSALAGGTGSIRQGEPFPTLILPSIENGEPASVQQYRGHKVVLHVFASW